jgi:hypothetical protein
MTNEGGVGVAVFVKIGFAFPVICLVWFLVSRLCSAGCMANRISFAQKNIDGFADVVDIGSEKPQGYGTP